MDERDPETRDRLLAAAARLFAERGFEKVTVRDICRKASANVAAVNYHFRGKLGLYHEVLQAAIKTMQSTTVAAREAGDNRPPEEQLRAYIHVFVERVAGGDRDSWIHQLMMREMSDPTPALDLVVDEVIRPRMHYLRGIVSKLVGCAIEDARVVRCAHSVHAQCLALLNNPVAERVSPEFRMTPDRIVEMADHITRFSLAGIHELAKASATDRGHEHEPQRHRGTEKDPR